MNDVLSNLTHFYPLSTKSLIKYLRGVSKKLRKFRPLKYKYKVRECINDVLTDCNKISYGNLALDYTIFACRILMQSSDLFFVVRA